MRTYEKFIVEVEGFQGKMSPDHDAKKGSIAVQNLLSKPKPKPKPGALAVRPITTGTRPNAGGALVPSRSQLAKTPADKGRAIVRLKQSAPSKDAVGRRAPAQKGYMTSPDGIRKPNNPGKSKNPIHGTTTSKNSQKPGGPSAYDRARNRRDIENRLDSEDAKKGKYKKFAKNALGAAGNFIKKNSGTASTLPSSKGQDIKGPQITNN